jgi:MFS family permease
VLLGLEIGQAGTGYLKRGAGHDPAFATNMRVGCGTNRRAREEMVLAAGATGLTLVHTGKTRFYRLAVVLLIALTVVLDGLDNQMLGLAAPALLHEWGLPRSVLGGIFALGFVGMALGTLAAGQIGDARGRRVALLLGVAVFALATLATGFAGAVWHLAALKMLAGVGLGGVPGTAAAMIAEFSVARWRSLAVTFGVVCVSIGGILGGVAAAAILPGLGWRWLFWCSGAGTLAAALVLVTCCRNRRAFWHAILSGVLNWSRCWPGWARTHRRRRGARRLCGRSPICCKAIWHAARWVFPWRCSRGCSWSI